MNNWNNNTLEVTYKLEDGVKIENGCIITDDDDTILDCAIPYGPYELN